MRKVQVLVRFDPAFAQADEIALAHKVQALTAETDRIEAELNIAPTFVVAPTDGPERKTQAQIFLHEMAEYSSEMAVRDSRVGAIDAQLKAVNASIAGLRRQLEMVPKVVDIRNHLLEQKAGAPLDVMSAESNKIDVDTRLRNAIWDVKNCQSSVRRSKRNARLFSTNGATTLPPQASSNIRLAACAYLSRGHGRTIDADSDLQIVLGQSLSFDR